MAGNEANAALQLLERALCLEIDGEEFYRQAATRTADVTGQKMFLDLAEQEGLHQQIIRRQMDNLNAHGVWMADERFEGATCDLSQSLFPQGAARARAVGPRADELEALWLALEKESQSYELYRQGALQTQDPLARALYQYLMSAEREHFNTLMTNYDGIMRENYRPD